MQNPLSFGIDIEAVWIRRDGQAKPVEKGDPGRLIPGTALSSTLGVRFEGGAVIKYAVLFSLFL
jgi:hypothetical protein